MRVGLQRQGGQRKQKPTDGVGATQSWQELLARWGCDWEEPVAAKARLANRRSDRALTRRQGQGLAWLERCVGTKRDLGMAGIVGEGFRDVNSQKQ